MNSIRVVSSMPGSGKTTWVFSQNFVDNYISYISRNSKFKKRGETVGK